MGLHRRAQVGILKGIRPPDDEILLRGKGSQQGCVPNVVEALGGTGVEAAEEEASEPALVHRDRRTFRPLLIDPDTRRAGPYLDGSGAGRGTERTAPVAGRLYAS